MIDVRVISFFQLPNAVIESFGDAGVRDRRHKILPMDEAYHFVALDVFQVTFSKRNKRARSHQGLQHLLVTATTLVCGKFGRSGAISTGVTICNETPLR
jgi:hypothetical protein